MPTTRETILAVLHARLSALPASSAGRRAARACPTEGLLILRDGEPGEPEVTLSPLRYHYQQRAEIEAAVQGADRDAAFGTLCAMPSRRHNSAMLSSPVRPPNKIRIFSAAQYCLRVARRMSLMTYAPWLCLFPGFCLISTPWWLRCVRNPPLSKHPKLSHWR
jgi:hypothetical protein